MFGETTQVLSINYRESKWNKGFVIKFQRREVCRKKK
jgi:hypothetical protein